MRKFKHVVAVALYSLTYILTVFTDEVFSTWMSHKTRPTKSVKKSQMLTYKLDQRRKANEKWMALPFVKRDCMLLL